MAFACEQYDTCDLALLSDVNYPPIKIGSIYSDRYQYLQLADLQLIKHSRKPISYVYEQRLAHCDWDVNTWDELDWILVLKRYRDYNHT